MHKHRHEETVERWLKDTEGMKKDDKPPKPRPRFPHVGGNYTPEALDYQLELHEKDGLGAGGFHIATTTLEELGFGTVCKNGTTAYKAERAMPGQT